mmetsp:Transcript_12565/g.15219  ORF Transcript_12565/g.15219 Transcript_12565/m.15219 type:complete len:85 (+) Transcript_12565:556-810(+)
MALNSCSAMTCHVSCLHIIWQITVPNGVILLRALVLNDMKAGIEKMIKPGFEVLGVTGFVFCCSLETLVISFGMIWIILAMEKL